MELTELVPPPPAGGRIFAIERRAGLADAAPGGRVRMDALVRWLQDVAYDDMVDARIEHEAFWVVRRNRIRVERFPRFGEHVSLRTWASGSGRLWAERRTTIAGEQGGAVEAVGLWVTIDPERGIPVRLPDAVARVYESATRGRQVKARLRHPPPPPDAPRMPWRFRASDADVADHVNNAAYWTPFEELLAVQPEPESIDAEIEFRDPAQPGDVVVVGDTSALWITGGDGVVHASVVTG